MFSKVPNSLRKLKRWILWRSIKRKGLLTKIPYQLNGIEAKSNDSETWSTFEEVTRGLDDSYSGIGFVFQKSDQLVGVDLDGCRDPETGTVAEWAREIVKTLDSYSEISPSKTGIKIFCRGKSPFDTGKKIPVDAPRMTELKRPEIEIYDHGRFFAVTGERLAGVNSDVNERTSQVAELKPKFWKADSVPVGTPIENENEIIERARKYLFTIPRAVSGENGSSPTFRAACILQLGFGLTEAETMSLLREWNQSCVPPWSEKELIHKVKDAGRQPGPRNYLRNQPAERFTSVKVPHYQQDKPKPQVRHSTLQKAAAAAFDQAVSSCHDDYHETGLPDVDYAIGGGYESGELIVLGARTSHGKSAVALQMVHTATANGTPCLLISEEMSEIQIGKRVLLYASELPQEHWQTDHERLQREMECHFEKRAECFIAESCRTIDSAVKQIRDFVSESGVKLVVVDYAQLLRGRGSSKYEQVSDVSVQLKGLCTELEINVILIVQLSRRAEEDAKGKPMMPRMSHIKDSGQLEQDADVVILMVYPHRMDVKQDPYLFQFFVCKNRNRAINQPALECNFTPSRQMFSMQPVSFHPNYNSEFDQ